MGVKAHRKGKELRMEDHSIAEALKQHQPLKQSRADEPKFMDAFNVLPALKAGVEVRVETGRWLTIEVTRSTTGKALAKPILAKIPAPTSKREGALYTWIVNSLSRRMPSLIPFTFQNTSVLEPARQLHRHTSRSRETLYIYVYSVNRFCRWIKKTPDQLVAECGDSEGSPDSKALHRHSQFLDDWIADLQADGLAPLTIAGYAKGVKALYVKNRLPLNYPYRLSTRVKHRDRAPKPEELQLLIDVAGIRDKVIVSCLALGGFREGTLAALKYYHIKEDLERGIIPLHIHVEAEITKGKYHDYDTFLGRETVEYLKAYLDYRRRGSPRGLLPSEDIHDESPLLRVSNSARVRPITEKAIYNAMCRLYHKAGLTEKRGRMYALRTHSIRKYFRTQLTALGVNSDYVEYMMGHTVSTYHDIQMKGIEFLRNIYAAADLSIRPRTRIARAEQLKELVRILGYDPEKVLVKETLLEPHRVHISPAEREEAEVQTLRKAVKELLRKELLDAKDSQKSV